MVSEAETQKSPTQRFTDRIERVFVPTVLALAVLLLFAWVPVALGFASNQMPAILMGVVSIGIVLGAGLAGALVRLRQVNRALLGGLLLGPLVLPAESVAAAETLLLPLAFRLRLLPLV